MQDIREYNHEDMEKTNALLLRIVAERLNAFKLSDKQVHTGYLRCTSAQQGTSFNSGANQSNIKILDVQVDTSDPPKFMADKNTLIAPPSSPAPVRHSSIKKVSVKKQQEWEIPANWKSANLLTNTDDRGLKLVHVSESLTKFLDDAKKDQKRKYFENSNMQEPPMKKVKTALNMN